MGYSSQQAKAFIDDIAPLMQKYAKQYGHKIVSAAIAQAICESAAGTSSLWTKYYNAFGMKCGGKWTGRSVNLSTKEEYQPGTLTSIKANFRVYGSKEEGIEGYYKFINTTRYANLKNATSAKDYLEKIKADGYATSSSYVNTNMSIVEKYDLTRFDSMEPEKKIEYYPAFNPEMVDMILRAIGVEDIYIGSKDKRKKLAEANGISGYVGSAKQNLAIIDLAKKGKLRRV